MIKFCQNCGSELKENADVCLNCGTLINKQVQPEVQKVKVPGIGLSITSMVLGVVASLWTLCEVIAIEDVYEIIDYSNVLSDLIAEIVGFTLFALIPSIIGLIFSIVGLVKKKSGFNISGFVLNLISLIITVVIIMYIISLY